MATFDAKFSNLTQQTEAASVAPVGGRGLGTGTTPSTSQPTGQQDFTLSGAWKELWESHLREREALDVLLVCTHLQHHLCTL